MHDPTHISSGGSYKGRVILPAVYHILSRLETDHEADGVGGSGGVPGSAPLSLDLCSLRVQTSWWN